MAVAVEPGGEFCADQFRGARRRARASRLALAGVATLAAGTLVVTQLPRPSVPATPLRVWASNCASA